MTGIMTESVKLLGTDLFLLKGEIVNLTPATNLPGGGYFALPRYRAFSGSEDNSIHLTGEEFEFIEI